MRALIAALLVLSLAACATNPDKLASAYVSPTEYNGDSCPSLNIAYARNNSEAAALYKKMKGKSRTNTGAATVGVLLFWPALFFMKGKDAESDSRMAELMGRRTAIETAMDKGNC